MPEDTLSLPFLTRKMLAFEHGVALSLRISSQASAAIALKIRGVTREGTFTFSHTCASTGAVSSEDFRIPDVPIILSVVESINAGIPGQVYVTVSLLANGDIIDVLCSGFVSKAKGISYPAYVKEPPIPGHGHFFETTSADPAAGAEISYTAPANRISRVHAMNFQFVTDANVANRRVHIQVQLPDAVNYDLFSDQDQAASLTRQYSVIPLGFCPDTLDDNDIIIPMPNELWLLPSSTIVTSTTNRQATDNFNVLNLLLESFYV